MTIKSSGELGIGEINAEFNRGNDLNAYRGVQWWTEGGSTGNFSSGLRYGFRRRFDLWSASKRQEARIDHQNRRDWFDENGAKKGSAQFSRRNSRLAANPNEIAGNLRFRGITSTQRNRSRFSVTVLSSRTSSES